MTTKRKKLILLFSAAFLLAVGAGAYSWLSSVRPPIETKFVQNVDQPKTNNQKQNESPGPKAGNVLVKEPGNSALVANPTHTYQTFNNCGPATLSMVLSLNGKSVSQKELGEAMRPYQIPSGDNDDKTIFTYEFVAWAKKYVRVANEHREGRYKLAF